MTRTRQPIPYATWQHVQYRYGGRCTCRPSRVIGGALSIGAWHEGLVGRPLIAVAVVLVGIGFPTTLRPIRCHGQLQRGHQWPHSRGGREGAGNLEPQCAGHNVRAIGPRWVVHGIARQWPPGLVAYFGRRLMAVLRQMS